MDDESGKIYIDRARKSRVDHTRKVRSASTYLKESDLSGNGVLQEEVVVSKLQGLDTEVRVRFYEDSRHIFALLIEKISKESLGSCRQSFSFVGNEITKLTAFLNKISTMQIRNNSSFDLIESENESIIPEELLLRRYLAENQELLVEILRNEITSNDVVAIGYRKKQLSEFKKLLREKKTKEEIWQEYFEKNSWIFGYGLGCVFVDSLNEKKLEQVVQGYSTAHNGKRVDALMKTKGIISNLCFVEIKTHNTNLLAPASYRSGCWPPSRELAGAIAQIQGTVSSAIENFSSKIHVKDQDGNPTGEEIFNYQPKSFLVIGNLAEFSTEHGVNREQLRSFQLLRRNTANLEIITYDELYERASFIVDHNENTTRSFEANSRHRA